jgi:branched-chain amino acid transport system substrate-binding protein
MARFLQVSISILVIVACLAGCGANAATPRTSPRGSAPMVAGTAGVANAPFELKIGIVVFLKGSAAEPFGLPAQQGAQALIDVLNEGGAPAPYATPGIAGVPIQAIYVDETGGADRQAAELRRLFTQENVDLVIGYISSSDCLAVAPLAEEMHKLTVVFDCGTSRLFEEHKYRYVFRTNAHQAIDSLGGARYLLHVRPGVEKVAGINQNYSWGQDSWAHFRDSLLMLKPDIQIVGEQFPKLGAFGYEAEISALKQADPEVTHTSFWGADLENLVYEANREGLLKESTLLMSVGEYALPDLGKGVPEGTIIGAHGPHGALAPASEMNTWLVDLYEARYHIRPTYPVYHMAQAILGIKLAVEKAAAAQNAWPTQEQIIDAFTGLDYPTPSGQIRLALGKGHQAVEPAVYATAGSFDPASGEVRLQQVVTYPAECVDPPEGKSTEEWIKEGFPGNNCPLD